MGNIRTGKRKGRQGMAKAAYLKELPESPTLEELLFAVNGMKKEKVFLDRVRRDRDGNVVGCFTKRGSVLYERLFRVLYALLRTAQVDDADGVFSHVQEYYDEVASEDF